MDPKETADFVQHALITGGAMWTYSGKPRRDAPHALLTSKRHSDGYVNVGQFLKDHPVFRRDIAYRLWQSIPLQSRFSFNWVVGDDTSSTDLAGDLAAWASVGHIRMAKKDTLEAKAQVWHADNHSLKPGDVILQITELVNTRLSVQLVRDGIRAAYPGMPLLFVPFVPVIVDRSNPASRVEMLEESKILPLLQLAISDYEAADCPYCKMGSQAIKPREGKNWQLLTAAAP